MSSIFKENKELSTEFTHLKKIIYENEIWLFNLIQNLNFQTVHEIGNQNIE